MSARKLTASNLRTIEAVLRLMADDLTELLDDYQLGAVCVRVLRDQRGVTVQTGRAHKRLGPTGRPPTEVAGFRREV